jgi:hypothetical protein
MSKIDDGGYAFPRAATETNNPNMFFEPQEGMTLRDYFAAAALQGWLASWPEQGTPHPSENYNALNVANLSYRMADAMLAARKEGANE